MVYLRGGVQSRAGGKPLTVLSKTVNNSPSYLCPPLSGGFAAKIRRGVDTRGIAEKVVKGPRLEKTVNYLPSSWEMHIDFERFTVFMRKIPPSANVAKGEDLDSFREGNEIECETESLRDGMDIPVSLVTPVLED
uniref:Uncharacterized protein n=1 Tax=Ananas comosus var. bracteatus TaxID=296719 RepID=A0A6V7NW81_ANACO|nr:unnamed protein product [Ananas comosus var. bracteatus]